MLPILTYRELFDRLTLEQLDKPIFTSAGCDENGNAIFQPVYAVIRADDDCIGAADAVFITGSPDCPILLFDEVVLDEMGEN